MYIVYPRPTDSHTWIPPTRSASDLGQKKKKLKFLKDRNVRDSRHSLNPCMQLQEPQQPPMQIASSIKHMEK